jgi:hypothetical protein
MRCPPPRGKARGAAGVWQVAEARARLHGWTQDRRVVFARKLQGQAPALAQGEFWQQVKHELAAYVTDLDASTANAWQVQALYREGADVENVFDEIKNQWGFSGFCAHARRHIAAAGSRRWFLVITARLVESGR